MDLLTLLQSMCSCLSPAGALGRKNMSQQDNPSQPQLKFRNYIPRSRHLRKHCIGKPTVDTIEKKLEENMCRVIEQSLNMDILSQVNPRKSNWDLKRDVQKKLSQLSRQTDAAILQLIRTRFADNSRTTETAMIAVATMLAETAGATLEESSGTE